MDEISMFAELRPAPPADADAIRAVVRGRVTSVLSEADPAARGWRPPARRSSVGPRRSPVRRRVLIGSGLVAAATAVAITIPAWLPGAGDTVMAKAWDVERNSDGTITIAVSEQFNDPAGLQQALAVDGITAFVTMNRLITGVNAKAGNAYSYDACDYVKVDYAPEAVQSAVVTGGNNTLMASPLSNLANWTWIIDPAALPAGSALLIPAWRSSDGDAIAWENPAVLRIDKPPVCTPNTPPPFTGLVPGQLPSQQVTAPTGPSSSADKPLSQHTSSLNWPPCTSSKTTTDPRRSLPPCSIRCPAAATSSPPTSRWSTPPTRSPPGRAAMRGAGITAQARNSNEFAHLAFTSLELVPPGVVLVSEWRPVGDDPRRPTPAEVNCYGGVARKP